MAETRWKIAFLFGLIGLTNGRRLSRFHLERNVQSDAKSNLQQNYLRPDENRYNQQRLSEAEFSTYSIKEPSGPGTYAFGYDNVVDETGNEQFRSEEKLKNGTVIGEFGYTDYKNGKIIRVSYIADTRGYRAKTEILPLDDIY